VNATKLAVCQHSLYPFRNFLFLSVIVGNKVFLYAVQNKSYSDGWLISECAGLCRSGEIVVSSKERIEETGI
jgi:hypothetical protein